MKSISIRTLLLTLAAAAAACNSTDRSEPNTSADAAQPAGNPEVAASPPPSETRTQESAASAVPSSEVTTVAGTQAEEPAGKTPDVIYVPTPQQVVDKMLELAKVKKTDIVYDLGCGDGRIVVTAAKKYGARAFGFDVDPRRIKEARDNVKAAGVEDLVTIEQKDIFTLDLSPASVVTLYLLPELNVRLIPQLQALKPGSRIVSHDFDMEGVTPLKQLSLKPEPTSRSHEVFLWHAPIKKAKGS